MTKADIAKRIQDNLGLDTQKEAAFLLESVLNIMKTTLQSGEDIKISSFGIFALKNKTARRGRNPQTGENLTITPRRVLRFKPSPHLIASLNGADVKKRPITKDAAARPTPKYLDWRKRPSLLDLQKS